MVLHRPAAWDLGRTVVEVVPDDGRLEVRYRAEAMAGRTARAEDGDRASHRGRGPPRRTGRSVV
jgi:hypothetical protein